MERLKVVRREYCQIRRERRLWAATIALTLAAWVAAWGAADAQGGPPGVGRPVVLEGTLDVLVEDYPSGSRAVHHLEMPDGRRIPLRFRGDPPDLPTGARVRVDGDLAADGTVTTSSVTTTAVPTSQTLGDKSVLVILFNFTTNTSQPFTTLAAESVNAQVRNFYLENSFQQTALNFTVTGWHTIAASTATCDYYTWQSQADTAAASAGFNVSSYARRVYAFPSVSACGWAGMGNVGGPRSWINGSYGLHVVAHELGHNFGDQHSHARKCDLTGCISLDYGDDRDVMGNIAPGHLNAFQKERLGWLNYGASPTIRTVTSTNDYWIDTYGSMVGSTKALKVPIATGGAYYIEFRDRVGFDTNAAPGVVLRIGTLSNSNSSYQIDLAPTTTTWDSTLEVGQTFSDGALGLSVTTVSTSAEGALVRVAFNELPCATSAPGVSLSPAAQTSILGATLQYTMNVTNTNSASCGDSPFSLTVTIPSGWSGSLGTTTFPAIAPGSSASTILSLTPSSSASGTVNFQVSATEETNGTTGAASGSATVGSGLALTASAVVSGGTKNRAATITVTANSGGAPIAGLAVTATIGKPTGGTAVLTAMTGSTGVATLKYSLRNQPSGTYSVVVTGSSGNVSSSATTSFAVP